MSRAGGAHPSEGGGYADLSPINFLVRAARAFPERQAISEPRHDATYAELLDRAERLGGALRARGVAPGDRVATVLPNTGAMLETHFGVPGTGGVLVPLNYRLAGPELRFKLAHSGARCVIADADLADRVEGARGASTPGPRSSGARRRATTTMSGPWPRLTGSPSSPATSGPSSRSTTRAGPPARRRESCTRTAEQRCTAWA
jgi:acyl-CoA synthetase (AMP-forming)/AMP-acid ligase II